jgi:hypothetical protein
MAENELFITSAPGTQSSDPIRSEELVDDRNRQRHWRPGHFQLCAMGSTFIL